MKALLLTLLVACIATTSFAQETRKVYTQSHVLEKQGSGQITRDDLRKRLSEIESILKSVEWTPKREPARQMTKEQHDTEVEWNKWLLGIRNRLKAQATDIQVLLKKKLSEEEMVEKMAAMNMQFLALQEATQQESRKFQTLSNASKARHETAMNAIRNMK